MPKSTNRGMRAGAFSAQKLTLAQVAILPKCDMRLYDSS